MDGNERRKNIIGMLRQTQTPLSGEALGKANGVSRQIVVQDIALLRSAGCAIVSTARGYMLGAPARCERLFKVCHTDAQTADELTTIVDLGGCVVDVMVNHRVYGKMRAVLNIKNRRDVQKFLEGISGGKSSLLLNVTSGYHFHHVSADSEEILDEIGNALREKGYLTPFMPYENADTL